MSSSSNFGDAWLAGLKTLPTQTVYISLQESFSPNRGHCDIQHNFFNVAFTSSLWPFRHLSLGTYPRAFTLHIRLYRNVVAYLQSGAVYPKAALPNPNVISFRYVISSNYGIWNNNVC
jgi:hypothetical protein